MIAKELGAYMGIRVTKGRLAAFIPAAGALFNSGYNAYLMDNICDVAYTLYRERYLARYYDDPGIIIA